MNLPPDLVIFDCDGVLVDSEPLTAEVLRSSLRNHGLALSPEELDSICLGGTISGLADAAREMGAQLPPTWVGDVYEEMFEVLAARVEIIPGVNEVLAALDAKGVGYAVGSNGPHRKMDITLARTGLMTRFSGRVYSREDVVHPKPAPDVYLKAADEAGIAPGRCVVIEDSPSGARAAKAAGMLCFGYFAQTGRSRLEAICDELFEDMTELPTLLGL